MLTATAKFCSKIMTTVVCRHNSLFWFAGELLEPADRRMDRTTLGDRGRLKEGERKEKQQRPE